MIAAKSQPLSLSMILLLNGAFGVGKTTVARLLRERIRRSAIVDPELIGIPLQRLAALVGRRPDDFQDMRSWRRLTIRSIRAARLVRRSVIVPIAISNRAYLDEIRAGVAGTDAQVVHVCLTAPIDVVRQRLHGRGADPVRNAWEFRRAAECCDAHDRPEFARQIDTVQRPLADIVADVLSHLDAAVPATTY